MGWALSSLMLGRFYADLTLYTDNVSAKILIDELRLPYSSVVCNLDQLNKYPSYLWALPKIHAYNQDTPFLHVDGDVFIWEPFSEKLLKSELIAQNEEISNNYYYEKIMSSLEKELDFFPDEILEQRATGEPIRAYNAGIFGGHDIEFLRRFCRKAYEFIDKNQNRYAGFQTSNFSIIFEQYLFYCFTKRERKEVKLLIDDVKESNGYQGFGDFFEVPYRKKYLHLSGDFKTTTEVCNQLANRLRNDFPEYYYKIISIFKKNRIPIFKDYYWIDSDSTLTTLLTKHTLLKNNCNINTHTNSRKINTWFLRTERLEDLRRIAEKCPLPLQQDYLNFVDHLETTLKTNFSQINLDNLASRDLNATENPELIFGDGEPLVEKVIVAEGIFEVINCEYDWADFITRTLEGSEMYYSAKFQEYKGPSELLILIIPECDQNGFSLVNIDKLEYLILDTLKVPTTIFNLLESIKLAFDPTDVMNSWNEIENLVLLRVKSGISNKIIKPYPNMLTQNLSVTPNVL